MSLSLRREWERRSRTQRMWLAVFVVWHFAQVAYLVWAVWFLTACSPAATPAAAEAAFTADLLHCVDKATTLAESKACRREVHQRWGIVETLRDGGAE